MGQITVPCKTEDVSDGYHTFSELYEHRIYLFIALMSLMKDVSWFSKLHDDGTKYEDWFVAGINLPSGQITYHLPNYVIGTIKEACIKELEKAPKFDGHTPNDVINRLCEFILFG